MALCGDADCMLTLWPPVQVLRFIAERMHLRHPNLVTVMGVSAEPITEDPLLVWPWHLLW